MKKLIIIMLMAVSTMVIAQEKDYRISLVPTNKGGTWGAIPAVNGQLIFVDNAANVNKNDMFDSRLLILGKDNKEYSLPSFEKYEKIGSPYISANGDEIFVTVSGPVASLSSKGLFNTGTNVYPLQIFISKKGENNEWAEPESFKHNSNTASSGDPCLSPDGAYLYFASNREGGQGGTDIYRCKRYENNVWGDPENLGDRINTKGDERFPRFDSEGNLYFSSSTGSTGGLDLFVCKHNGNDFGTPVRMNYPFNSDGDDFAISFISNNSGYLSSNRSGSDHIYFFEPEKTQIVHDTIKVVEVKKEVIRPDLILEELLKNGKLKYIYFDFNKDNIRQSEISAMIDLLVFMRQYPTVVLELPSYADCRGNDSYNIKLSNRRGESVKSYLVSTGGIPASRIVVRELGATNPVISDCDCSSRQSTCDDEKYQLNRRVEYKVLSY